MRAVRFANTSDLDEYLGNVAVENPFRLLDSAREESAPDVDVIRRDEAFEESLFLGLRFE